MDMPSCCIFHEFLNSASKDPDRVSIVRSNGGLFKNSRAKLNDGTSSSIPTNFDFNRLSSNPQFFPGDDCFTYEELRSAVDHLSRRIRCVLDGADPDNFLNNAGYARISHVGLELEESDGFGLRSRSYIPHIVGVQIGPSVEYIVAVLSILRCGEAFLPLDPSWPEERILSVVSSSRTRLVIKVKSDSMMKCGEEQMDGSAADWVVDECGSLVLYFSMKEKFVKNVAQVTNLTCSCESNKRRMFCYLMYTSGSTGEPKGVCGTELGLLNRYWWMQDRYPISQEDVLLFKTSISFVDHLQEFLGAILARALLIIPPYHMLKYPEYIADFLEAYEISRLTTVPSLVRELLPSFDISQKALLKSLKVLVLSGEVLPVSLWRGLHDLLPKTTILNLYGSTEVAGDCACFDCERMPNILEAEKLSSVPVGKPVSNCEIVLFDEQSEDNVGEICVSGSCLFAGYVDEISHGQSLKDDCIQLHFRTGDIAKRLRSGDFVFLGRKDRLVKVRGQRIALEEIENVLRQHPNVRDAAVIVQNVNGDSCHLEAFFIARTTDEYSIPCVNRYDNGELIASIKSWLLKKLPTAMLPTVFVQKDMLPKSFSGKVDYSTLRSSTYVPKQPRREYEKRISDDHHLQVIKKAFIAALPVEAVSDEDDFFMLGGNSISAAHLAYNLGIDMRLLYVFPSPFKLMKALLDQNHNWVIPKSDAILLKRLRVDKIMQNSFEISRGCYLNSNLLGELVKNDAGMGIHDFLKLNGNKITNQPRKFEKLAALNESKNNISFHPTPHGDFTSNKVDPWLSNCGLPRMCSFSRCNSITLGSESLLKFKLQACSSLEISMRGIGHLQELWKVLLESCVDSSPVILLQDDKVFLFIGSHARIFICIDAFSGIVRWQTILEGRIECSAAITGDFSQVVVGCYEGKIYFLDCTTGSILWTFHTSGEVKMQPVVDEDRCLIWCGSHDHHLYALDYRRRVCVSKIFFGGSIYGSPAVDKARSMLYVATTSGFVSGVSLEVTPFSVLWRYETDAPIFGSMCLDSCSGNVFFCSVNGSVMALNPKGHIIWKASVGGPVFAGACISFSLPSQLLICSRNGGLYSFEMENGALLWEYQTGDPITASAYVDDLCCLISKPAHPCHRLVCICSSSGKIHVLRVHPDAKKERAAGVPGNQLVEEFAVMNLPGDSFSSPVMIAGRIFIGCRDDYVHCVFLKT